MQVAEMSQLFSAVAVAFICLVCQTSSKGLKEEFSWTFINYVWPENTTSCPGQTGQATSGSEGSDFIFPSYTEYAPKRGYFNLRNRLGEEEQVPEYTLENNIPMGATRYKNKLFITVPRRRVGIPSTLNYVDLDCPARKNVPLRPYPNWEQNTLTSSPPEDPSSPTTPFVSVYRTTVDACDRLWFVDMGTLEYPTGRQQIQQFALIVMDLKTDRIIRRFQFNTSDVNPLATLASVTVDVTKNTCNDAFAYIPDLVNYKTLVYSWRENTAWRVAHNYFFLDPISGEFNIGGHQFQWTDGIFSITLSKPGTDGHRTAFFHPMASVREFSVSTRILKDRSLATRSYHGNDFKIVGDRGLNGQSSTHALDEQTGIILMGEVNKNGLYCWNTNKPLMEVNQGEIQANPQTMIYPSDVKIDQYRHVWMMTNSMPRFLYGTLNYDEVNFRVWTNSIDKAVSRTKCVQ